MTGSVTGTLLGLAADLRAGRTTSRALVEASVAMADALDDTLGVYLARFDDAALEAADRADAELARGLDRGPLHGIPVGIKDLVPVAEGPTTAQSLVLDEAWGRDRDAVVARRLKAAGAVLTGKTTTMEFALGMADPVKPFPQPRNPWDLDTWPGGSSSGSASGVVAGVFAAAIGSDTTGSIRVPAAFCGVTGLLPTYGRVPKADCVPLGYSLDGVGPLARSASDCAAVLEAITAHDDDGSDTSWRPPADGFDPDLTGVRVGVARAHHFPPQADPALAPTLDAAVEALERLGASCRDVELPLWDETLTAGMVTMCAEGLAYHRNDLAARWDDYFASTRKALALGALVSAADYVQAQRVRRVAQRKLGVLMRDVDVILAPTTAGGAPRFDTLIDADGRLDLSRHFQTTFTPFWNCVGLPVVAMPYGATAAGLPMSVQVAARPWREADALRVAAAYQQVTDWHLRTPELVRR